MSELPIGYWLKHLDRLIENDFDRILASQGLGRRHWQVLHSLRTDPGTIADLDRALAPFLEEEEYTVTPVVEQLRQRGWVRGLVSLELTAAGRERHEALFAKVQEAHRRISRDIDDEEYRVAVGVLKRMSANLEQG